MKPPNTLEPDQALHREIKDFFNELSSRIPERQVCPRCRNEMEYLSTTFRWFGADSSWEVWLPICRCELNELRD